MSAKLFTSRRAVLGGVAASLGAPAIVRAQGAYMVSPFSLGVASGDPAPDGFVIWTRLAPDPMAEHSGMPAQDITVSYEVAEDEAFRSVVQKGDSLARPELGHSVHVEVAGLRPDRPYWYRFTTGGERSAAGKARTLPLAGAALQRLRFVAAGCQHYEAGLFTAYRHIAQEQLDFVWHYGDYIYEGRGSAASSSPGQPTAWPRKHFGQEIYSLDDYRRRYAQYKLDPDLQAAHAAHSWWVTWDDHETDNNWASDFDQDGTPPEIFALRRQASAQAYYENMPLRRTSIPRGPAIQIYRRAAYGDLLAAHFLDTRQFRMDQPCGDGVKPLCADALKPDRTIMGADQERWLFQGLDASTSRWNLIAQQVMVMSLDRRTADEGPPTANMDSWGGYPAARERLLDHLQDRGLKNVVVATGDEHQNFVGDLKPQKSGQTVGVEFVATSIATGGDGVDQRDVVPKIMAHNPHLKFLNSQRGYVVSEIGRDTWVSDLKVVDYVTRPGAPIRSRIKFAVERGQPGWKPA